MSERAENVSPISDNSDEVGEIYKRLLDLLKRDSNSLCRIGFRAKNIKEKNEKSWEHAYKQLDKSQRADLDAALAATESHAKFKKEIPEFDKQCNDRIGRGRGRKVIFGEKATDIAEKIVEDVHDPVVKEGRKKELILKMLEDKENCVISAKGVAAYEKEFIAENRGSGVGEEYNILIDKIKDFRKIDSFMYKAEDIIKNKKDWPRDKEFPDAEYKKFIDAMKSAREAITKLLETKD